MNNGIRKVCMVALLLMPILLLLQNPLQLPAAGAQGLTVTTTTYTTIYSPTVTAASYTTRTVTTPTTTVVGTVVVPAATLTVYTTTTTTTTTTIYQPSVKLSLTSGPPGTNVALSGSDFDAGDTGCTISSSPSGLFSASSCTVLGVSAGAMISGAFTVAPGATGPYAVTVTGGPTGDYGGASFTVTLPGTPIRISSNAYDSLDSSVAVSGSYVYVAWSDSTPVSGNGGQPEIWLRVSSNYGASFGSPIRISTNTGNSLYPSVAAIGSYVYVAWQDNTPVTGSGGYPEIWMRASSNNGASFGSAIRISTNAGNSYNPSVAADGSYVYVGWQDDTPVAGTGTGYEVWMRASSNNAASFGSAIRISTNTYDSVSPSVAASGTYVYLAWEDYTPVAGSGTAPEIWMRVSANSGASFGSAIRTSTNTGTSANPSVAASGSYVYVAWQDDTPVTGSGGKPEIWMRGSSNNAATFGSAVRMSTNAYDSDYPRVAASGSYVYVAWHDYTPVSGSGGAAEVWLRVSSNNGATFGSAIRRSTNAYDSLHPCVAASGGVAYVAWEDYTPVSGSGTAPEIWLRIGS